MSTTGFGRRGPDADTRPATNDRPQELQTLGVPRRESINTTRPPPQFDMDLRDLFPKDIQDERPSGSHDRSWRNAPTSMPTLHKSNTNQSNYSHDNSYSRGSSANSGRYDSPMSQDYGTSSSTTYGPYGYLSDMNFLMDDATTHNGSLDFYPGIYDWDDGTQWHPFDGFFFGGQATNSGQ